MIVGVPVINRPDLLARFVASIDTPVKRLVVIDNSPTGDMTAGLRIPDCVDEYIVSVQPGNLGVAGSWNHVIRTHPAEPWWCIANADTELGPGDLAKLGAEMDQPGPRWVGMNGDWRVFGLSSAAVDAVGLYDENLYPCYLEDCDYEWRCRLAGVPWYTIEGGATHVGSAAINSDLRYRAGNDRSYPANLAYYEAKWGGPHRVGERFSTPFDRGGSVRDWTLDVSRLRTNAW